MLCLGSSKSDAARVFIISNATLSLGSNIMFTLAAIYHITFFGMSPLQLVLIGTAHQITVLLCEIPTGLIADLRSRRLSVILGVLIIGLASLLIGGIPWMANHILPAGFPLFLLLVVGEIIRGVGATCISGAQDAWLTDEIGQQNISPVFLRSSQVSQAAGLAGMFISIALSSWALHLPFLAGALLHAGLAVYLIRAMREENFRPAPRSGKRLSGALDGTLRAGLAAIRGKQVLVLLMVATFFAGAASEGFDRLWEAHFLKTLGLPEVGNLDSVFWFGLLNLGAKILSIAALSWARVRLDTRADWRVSRYLAALSGLHLVLMLAIPRFSMAWPLKCLPTELPSWKTFLE